MAVAAGQAAYQELTASFGSPAAWQAQAPLRLTKGATLYLKPAGEFIGELKAGMEIITLAAPQDGWFRVQVPAWRRSDSLGEPFWGFVRKGDLPENR